eukprot:GHVU01097429.1.p2 GENE.GHVU01097429.1~~GHVU01097429.1.p2  ORF type:complete len:130 (-),score=7.59 GHVU01097429.1:449-838(-)
MPASVKLSRIMAGVTASHESDTQWSAVGNRGGFSVSPSLWAVAAHLAHLSLICVLKTIEADASGCSAADEPCGISLGTVTSAWASSSTCTALQQSIHTHTHTQSTDRAYRMSVVVVETDLRSTMGDEGI